MLEIQDEMLNIVTTKQLRTNQRKPLFTICKAGLYAARSYCVAGV